MEARPRRVLSQGRAAGEVRKVHWNRLVRGVAGQREQRQREQRQREQRSSGADLRARKEEEELRAAGGGNATKEESNP